KGANFKYNLRGSTTAAFCFAAASTFFVAAVLAVFFGDAGFFSAVVFLVSAAFLAAGAFFATFFPVVFFTSELGFCATRFTLPLEEGLVVESLNEPDAPFPLVCTTAPDVTAARRYRLMKGANFSPSTL
ncbi:hypothetical protein ALC53_02942, partial [Atta colombica]